MQKLIDFINDLVDAILPRPEPEARPVPVRVDDGRPRPPRRHPR